MKITTDLVNHLAELSRLKFNENEIENFTVEFQQILNYIDQLNDVVTDENTKIDNCLNASTDLKEDEIKNSIDVKLITKIAPKTMGNSIVVPTVVEEE